MANMTFGVNIIPKDNTVSLGTSQNKWKINGVDDPKLTDTTYSNATTSAAGLMSATDKTKLDGIASGAQINSITGIKGNAENSYRTGNVNITAENIGLGNVENKSSATIRGELTKENVTTALGYTPPTTNTNTTYSLTQDSSDGHKITLTPSSGTAQTITIPDNNTDTHRPVQVNGTQILGNDTTALNLKAGSNVSISNSSGTVIIAATDTTYSSKAAASGGTDVSLVTTGEKATWNAKTSNVGTITGITMNGTSKGTSGVIDLGTVITSHQDISGKAPLASPALTGTPTAPTAATTTENTQIATTAYVKNKIDSVLAANDAMIFKGTIGSSGATVTALPNTHNAGWTYKVITAATYAGKVCEVGDLIICIADGTTANNDHWTVVQTNVDGAVTGPTSSTGDHIATFNGTSGKVIKDSGYTIAKSVPSNAVFTDTDTKVTAVGNHYTPAEDTSAKLSVDASSSTAATWNSTSLVTGVDIKRDAKGHVVGVAVDSIKMPANPNSDTHRAIQVNGTQALGNNTTALNLKAGSNVTITDGGSGAITIAATDTNTWRGIQDNLTSSSNTTESLSAKQGYLLANGSARDDTKVEKTTYEYNREISFGSSGLLLIGKFPCYDSNVTIEIRSTTSQTYYAVAILATQNINTTGGGTFNWCTYGDTTNSVTANLYAKYVSGSRYIEIYFVPQHYSKNLIHIQAVALSGAPTNICESVTSKPAEATRQPTNTAIDASYLTSGTLSADRLATSGATAGSYGDSSAQTPGYGSTFKVPYVTVDNKGRVTAISDHTVKIPASDNTWRPVSDSVSSTSSSDAASSKAVKTAYDLAANATAITKVTGQTTIAALVENAETHKVSRFFADDGATTFSDWPSVMAGYSVWASLQVYRVDGTAKVEISGVNPSGILRETTIEYIDTTLRPEGPIAVEQGGTGADTAAGARINLGITPANIGAVSTSAVIGVSNGGTGATSASAARTNLGITPANIGAVSTSAVIDLAHGGTGATKLPEARRAIMPTNTVNVAIGNYNATITKYGDICILTFTDVIATVSAGTWTPLATLSSGYKPASDTGSIVFLGGMVNIPALVHVSTTGALQIFSQQGGGTSGTQINGQVVYIAAQ